MKLRNLILMLVVFTAWTGLFAYWVDFRRQLRPPATVCNPMEESRLKIALNECSDAVIFCTWGEESEGR